jgi:carbamoyltransferase
VENFLLGLNLSHDSSASIHRSDGKLIGALEEERFTRRKNEASFPSNSIRKLFQSIDSSGNLNVSKIVIGSHRDPNDISLQVWHQIFNPPMHPGWPNQPYTVAPGSHIEIDKLNKRFDNSADYVEFEIQKALEKNGSINEPEIKWIAHHDAHSASGAFGAPWHSSVERTLAFSLDGSGDNESGVVQIISKSGFIEDLVRIPFTESLGLVYSEVTGRYGFKKHRHEGKITGLAALGDFSPAVEYLYKCLKVEDGAPKIVLSKNKFTWILNRLLVRSKFTDLKKPISIERMIETATALSPNYADLAFAIQEVIEERIIEIVKYWINISGVSDITLGGGVFSNVKINQKIAELPEVKKVFIFPNMGDGGLSAGGVWRSLHEDKLLGNGLMFDNMYLGPQTLVNRDTIPENIKIIHFEKANELFRKVATLIAEEYIAGSCIGKMEFGPRALGNRSILAAPFNYEINKNLNSKLHRTEFMPFAPIVMAEYASDIFDLTLHHSLEPFKYMTMTCNVKDKWKKSIPAVVHTDGTARPQFVDILTNPIIYRILAEFYKITNVPVLINTSFNTHEEPIIENLTQGIASLLEDKVDFIFDESNIYFKMDNALSELN